MTNLNLDFGRMMKMNINSQNQIPTDIFPTNNPLFQLISNSPQNYMMFFTQFDNEHSTGGGNYCCICGTYELNIMPIDVRMQKSICLSCYNRKVNLDNQIEKMLRPYHLTEVIFGISA
jgi:hypothetical protein